MGGGAHLGSSDTTVLVWDPRGMVSPAHSPPLADFSGLWDELGSEDASQAFRAMCALATAADRTLDWVKQRLHPIRPPDPRRLAQLMADLDDAQFGIREKANQELEKLGELAAPHPPRGLEIPAFVGSALAASNACWTSSTN